MYKPRVLLIAPTGLDYYGKPIKQKKLYLPGLTFPMLAAVTPEDVELNLVTETIQDIPWEDKWDLVGITGMGSGLVRAWEIADYFRSKKIPVIIGGITASLCKEEWSYEHADVLVKGEAEDTWKKVLLDFLNGKLKNKYDTALQPDINKLPLPSYDKMHPNELGLWRPVQATRGCPFSCSFCSIQAYYKRQYRKRPISDIIRDVRAAKSTGSNYIAFIDDNIGVDWNYLHDLILALIPEKIIWISQCSIHIANKPEMLKLAYQSGCRCLSFGIESVNQNSINAYGKTFNKPNNYDELLGKVRDCGIAVSTEMIVGLEHDTTETFQETYEFVMRNKIPIPKFYILTPVPGTPMYDEFMGNKRIFDHNMKNYTGGKVVYKPNNMSGDELEKNYWKLYNKLYTVTSIYKRMCGLPSGMGFKLRTFFLGVNLHYKKHIKQRIPPGIV